MMQHALKLCNCLHLVDVGAVIDRPRAIDNRPYGFYRKVSCFATDLFYGQIVVCHLGRWLPATRPFGTHIA